MATLIVDGGVVGSSQVERVAFLTGSDEDQVLGKLLRLWDASQTLQKSQATGSEITFWLRIRSTKKANLWLESLTDSLSGFLTLSNEQNIYIINGNKKHIEKTKAIREVNRLKALKRWEPRHAPALPTASNPDAPAMHTVMPELNQAEPSQALLNFHAHKKEFIEIWNESLRHRKIKSQPMLTEMGLLNLWQKYPDPESIKAALKGFRQEPDGEDFNAAKHMTLYRLLHKEGLFEKCVLWGSNENEKTEVGQISVEQALREIEEQNG